MILNDYIEVCSDQLIVIGLCDYSIIITMNTDNKYSTTVTPSCWTYRHFGYE